MSAPSESARPYGGRSAEERRAERRERLVQATVRVLGGRGLDATTMTAVCVEAGLTERYFYESFKHRDDALVAALDAVSDQIARVAVGAIDDAVGTPAARVHAALVTLVAWVDDDPVAARVALVESTAHPALRARRRALLGVFADLVVREAEELFGDEAWSGLRARAQGLLYVAGLAELVTARLVGDMSIASEELVEIGADSFEQLARRDRVSARQDGVNTAESGTSPS